MIYGYIRVSTDKQTVENQRFEIQNFCKRENLSIDGWIEETISGTKNYNKRALGHLLAKVQKDDMIICAELSRLGRNLFMIMEILNICMTKECKVWTIKDVSIRLRTTCIFDSKLKATCSSWPKLGQVDSTWFVLPTCLAGVPGELHGCSRSRVSGAGYPPSIHVD